MDIFGMDLEELGSLKICSDKIAKQCWVIFCSFMDAGFSREEALKLTKFFIYFIGENTPENANKQR